MSDLVTELATRLQHWGQIRHLVQLCSVSLLTYIPAEFFFF